MSQRIKTLTSWEKFAGWAAAAVAAIWALLLLPWYLAQHRRLLGKQVDARIRYWRQVQRGLEDKGDTPSNRTLIAVAEGRISELERVQRWLWRVRK